VNAGSISGAQTYNLRLQPLQLYFTTGAISPATLTQLQQTACPTTAATIMSRSYNLGVGVNDNGNVRSIIDCLNGDGSRCSCETKTEEVGGVIEGLTPGPAGTLTIASATKLRPDEIEAGIRVEKQEGLALVESAHEGADFIAFTENGAKTTMDAMGRPGAFAHWDRQAQNFLKQIVNHVDRKSVDKVAVDLTHASKAQIEEIKAFVAGLTKGQQKKIVYIQ
jgi:hypothetical protein